MNNKIVFFFLFVIFLFVVNNLSALTYFRLLVDGEETDTLIQGVDYYFQADCEPWDTVFFVIYEDFNDNGIIDGHEWSIWEGYDEIPTLIDNYEHPPEERGIFIDDIDPDLGELLFDVDLYWWVGDFIFKVWEGADTLVIPFHIAAPESLTMSVTGHVVIEGITPPNPAYFDILFWGGLFGPPEPIFMLFNTDSMGTFSFNWVGEPETIIIGFLDHDPPFESLGYRVEELFYYVYVDTHVTDVELYIPRFVPDTCTFHGYIATSEGEPVTCDSLFMVYYLDRYIPMPDDTFYVDADSGYFELRISMEMYEMIELGYKYYKIPTYLMTHSEFGMGSFYFNASDEIHDFEYTDTLFVKNDSFWVSYVYDYHTTPVMIDLPVKASNNRYGCTIVTVPYGSIVPFWICDNHLDTFWGTWYELTLASDDVLPPNYAFYNGGRYSVKVGDSVEIIIGEMRSFISGTLFSATGEIITDSTKFVLHQYSGSGGYLWYGYEIPIINGIYENTPLFSDTLYWFESDTFAGYMRPINDCRSFVPGYHTANFTLYPTDTFFSLYLEIDSSDPRDDVFQVELYSPEDDAMHSKRIPKNRWVSFPIYSGFSEPCRLLIKNLSLYGASPLPLTRLVENNGNIPVEAGDSILINMEAPIDYFIMEFVEDPADAWQHSLSPASLTICYYSREDTHIVYSYVPNDDCGMSLELPIFSEPMLVKPESPFWFDLHYFIANPDEYLIVGGAYRPDHVTRYFNKGTGEMLLSLDGYPADYLGDDTIFFPRGDFSGIETPEHPEHHYIADLFLFRTDMFHHPYGDGSVMAFHDVCDGEWTVVLPESLPGGFVPAVTETTFYVEDMSIYPDEWQEFPIAIPVKSPAGVHGYVNRELRFFEANLIQADFYVQGTDSLAATTRAWQYYPWGPPSILAKYYKRNTELPPNEYYLQLSFTGWTAEEPIIYPEQIEFSYTGDSLLLPDSYIAMTRGWAHVTVTGLDAEMYEGSYIHYYIHPDSVHEDIDFYDLDVSYPFPEPGSVLTLKLPAGSWIVKPVVPLGWLPTPAETVLNVPVYSDTLPRYFIDFDYSVVEETGGLMGNFVTDADDPSPLSVDHCQVTLYGPDGVTPIEETSADESGYFGLFDLAAPAEYYFGVDHELGREIFMNRNMREIEIPPSDTLELSNIYVDHGNATVRVNFVNTDADYIDFTRLRLRVSGIPSLPGNVYVPYTPFMSSGTFYLCDGVWTLYAPEISGIVFTPIETTIVVSEAIETHEIDFINVLSVDKDPVLPYGFSVDAYPNPFNGVLNIEFSIPRLSPVSLVVYDVRGREVALLIEERLPEGRYSIKWDCGESISSGVYFIHLRTDRQSKLLKRIYLK